jgi:Protein of unknown function (DUF1569)
MKTLARPGDRAEIVRRLEALRPTSTRRWGRMSAHQMVCHLSDSFRMCLGQREARPRRSWLWKTVVKPIALYTPIPWPRGVRTRPELDQECGGTKPEEFSADLASLVTLLETVTGTPPPFAGRSHPAFGPMSDAAWLRWGYLHMDHHLRQFGA